VVLVINRTALIENLLNQVIERYCAPPSDRWEFFWTVLLDSAIMPTGAKAKVAMAVAQAIGFKLDPKPIHRVMALRNAFAHHQTDAHATLVVGKTPDEDSSHFELHVITNSGRISRVTRQDALNEFSTVYACAKASLVALRDAITS
jgi:hypothetical protein